MWTHYLSLIDPFSFWVGRAFISAVVLSFVCSALLLIVTSVFDLINKLRGE